MIKLSWSHTCPEVILNSDSAHWYLVKIVSSFKIIGFQGQLHMCESFVDPRAKTAIPFLEFLVKLSLTGFVNAFNMLQYGFSSAANHVSKVILDKTGSMLFFC